MKLILLPCLVVLLLTSCGPIFQESHDSTDNVQTGQGSDLPDIPNDSCLAVLRPDFSQTMLADSGSNWLWAYDSLQLSAKNGIYEAKLYEESHSTPQISTNFRWLGGRLVGHDTVLGYDLLLGFTSTCRMYMAYRYDSKGYWEGNYRWNIATHDSGIPGLGASKCLLFDSTTFQAKYHNDSSAIDNYGIYYSDITLSLDSGVLSAIPESVNLYGQYPTFHKLQWSGDTLSGVDEYRSTQIKMVMDSTCAITVEAQSTGSNYQFPPYHFKLGTIYWQ